MQMTLHYCTLDARKCKSAESANVYDEQQKPVGMKKKKVGIRSA